MRPQRRVRRNGILFNLDIREGVDLSIFLFGSFQRHVAALIKRFVPPDGIVIDVGANIGAVALPIAKHLTTGHVYAVEPTDFAFSKLLENVALNPSLAKRITAVRTFISDGTRPCSDMRAYSSWPLASTPQATHPVHKGVVMHASCGQLTLDDFVAESGLQSLSLIKIDTDGHEYEVVAGARESINRFRPVVVFEACEYLMRPPRPTFENLSVLFKSVGYTVCGATVEPLTPEAFLHICPKGGGLDLVALPREHADSPFDT